MREKVIAGELNKLDQQIGLDKYKTALKKVQFINEIKNGLGSEIKENPNQIKIIKKTRIEKFKIFLKKIFTKF